MAEPLRYLGQAAVYAFVAALIGYFSQNPAWTSFPPDKAQVVLSFAHGAQRLEACRRLTPAEIAKLPPQQRRPNTCERERLPVRVRLEIDGQVVYDAVLPPTGIWGDGPARAYEKFAVAPGRHRIVVRLEDRGRTDAFGYTGETEVELRPGRKVAIDFKADEGGFLFFV